MLVLSRKVGEKIILSHPSWPEPIEICMVGVKHWKDSENRSARIGVRAPGDVRVDREEVWNDIQAGKVKP